MAFADWTQKGETFYAEIANVSDVPTAGALSDYVSSSGLEITGIGFEYDKGSATSCTLTYRVLIDGNPDDSSALWLDIRTQEDKSTAVIIDASQDGYIPFGGEGSTGGSGIGTAPIRGVPYFAVHYTASGVAADDTLRLIVTAVKVHR